MKNRSFLFIACTLFILSNIWSYSGTRTVKNIETEVQPSFSKITVTVDDHGAGNVEYYVYKYNCTPSDQTCYLNNSDGAKLVTSIALTALTAGLGVSFDYNYTDPNTNFMFYFKNIRITR